MRKIVLLLSICMYVFAGCSNKELIELNIPESIPYTEDWFNLNAKKHGLNNYSIAQSVIGRFNENSCEKSKAYLLAEKADADRIEFHNSYLAVEYKDRVLFKKLPVSLANGIKMADIDGNGTDEIIVQNTVGISGGVGQYISCIFQVNNTINEMFYSSSQSLFDTGYKSEFKENFLIVIKNVFTGYEKILDDSEKKYLDIFFDEKGKIINTEDIYCDSFYEFFPKDIDNDGVFEIVCLQYVSLYGHSDHIGFAESVLRYNTNTQQFDVVNASFKQISAP